MIIEISLITLGLLTVFTLTKKENDKKKLIEYTNMTNEKAKEQFDKVIKGTYQSPQEKIIKPSQEYKKSFAKEYHDTVQALKTPTPIKREFKPYTTEEKKEYAIRQRENKKKGDDYERFVGEHFKKQGYTIAQHGLDNGKKDHGIDIIAKKEKEIIFIQCKNWKVSKKYTITHSHLKEFIGNCSLYMEKNPLYATYTLRRYYAISNEIMDKSAEIFIKENPTMIQKLLLTMPYKNV